MWFRKRNYYVTYMHSTGYGSIEVEIINNYNAKTFPKAVAEKVKELTKLEGIMVINWIKI